MNMNLRACLLLFSCVAGFSVGGVYAQDYPAKSIRVIVAFTPGGTSDIVGRLVALKLTEAFGQQAIVDNRPGAGGAIGNELAAKSPADGYTLIIGHIGTLAVNPTLFSKLPYDPVRDFQPITLISKAASIMVVHPSLPVRTVREFIALAKAKPGALIYGSPGNGSAGHLLMAYFSMAAKVELLHVPYKGTAPALVDLIAGQTSTVFTGIPGILPHVQSGKLRVIGISSAKRSAGLPDVPTIAESGLPGFEVTQWWGVLAPAGTPRQVVTKLNEALNKSLQSPDMRKRLDADGAEPFGSTSNEFHEFIKSEIARWAPVIRAAGARPE
jgi:tripartite-type tricarboxylate transporter receptor subunit TctC